MGTIASFKWQGASGQQIGFAGDNPYDQYGPSFTADDIHTQPYDPNSPNTYAQTGSIGDVPIQIQDEYNLYEDGFNGWCLDNLHDPNHNAEAGTTGHNVPMAAANRQHVDPSHNVDIFQIQVPANHGINFYGHSTEDNEVYEWASSSNTPITTGSFPSEARTDTTNWPTPFDSYTVAPQLPVIRPTERVPMRRMKEDDRPVYRQLAVPAQNIAPSGSVYNPTMQSNRVIRNIKPLPAVGRTPVAPWSADELASASMDQGTDYVDPLAGGYYQ
jgi:hypothetical protein